MFYAPLILPYIIVRLKIFLYIKKWHQPGVFMPLRALALVSIELNDKQKSVLYDDMTILNFYTSIFKVSQGCLWAPFLMEKSPKFFPNLGKKFPIRKSMLKVFNEF